MNWRVDDAFKKGALVVSTYALSPCPRVRAALGGTPNTVSVVSWLDIHFHYQLEAEGTLRDFPLPHIK